MQIKEVTQQLTKLPKQLNAKVKDQIAPDRNTVSTWFTPWTWVDSGRVYYGDDGFWLYHELPVSVLYSSGKELRSALSDIHKSQPNSDIHLLLHNKTSPVVLPDKTPQKLAEVLNPLTELYSTATTVILGVKLQVAQSTSGKKTRKAVADITDGVDELLGEKVPDFESVEQSRTLIAGLLSTYKAATAPSDAFAALESWYLLGATSEPVVTEEETAILFPGMSTLTLAGIADVQRSSKPRHMPSPSTEQATTVLSVRGLTSDIGLSDASIIAGRRAQAAQRWVNELNTAFPECTAQALPLRQLPALSETLPCSRERMAPPGTDLPFENLTACGVSDGLRVGDRYGVHIGLTGTQYTELGWWNIDREPGQYVAVVGESGSGKTFLAEYWAIQYLTASGKVAYFSADGESARPLVTTYGVKPVTKPEPGLASLPFLPDDISNDEEFVSSLHQLVPGVSYTQWRLLLTNSDTDGGNHNVPLAGIEMYATSSAVSAHIVKQLNSNPIYEMLAGKGGTYTQQSLAFSLPHLLRGLPENVQHTVSDSLLASAILRGGLVIADGVTPGRLTWWALEIAKQENIYASLLLLSQKVLDSGPRPTAAIAAAQSDPILADSQLAWLGLASNEDRRAWLREADPRIAGSSVYVTPTMLIRDSLDRNAPLTVGPIPESLLPVLTRGRVTNYR